MREWLKSSTMLESAASCGATWLGATVAAMCLLGVPGMALADSFTPPAGVTDYRLAFVTDDTTDATSTTISDYNTFVTDDAANNRSLPATTWTAIASTPSTDGGVDAATNISCGTLCDETVPIFLVDGTTEVAASTDDLLSPSSIMNVIDEDENGNATQYSYVWTGSNADGTAATGNELGSSTPVFGNPFYDGGYNMIDLGPDFFDGSSDEFPLYAISGEISSAVPEPATLSLLAFGGAVLGLLRRRRPAR